MVHLSQLSTLVVYTILFCSLTIVFGLQGFYLSALLVDDVATRRLPADTLEFTPVHDMSLRYVPRSVVRTWSEHDYLLVLGIPSVDIDGRRRRRNLQRTTCWRFPGVATRANGFTGEMLVVYVLARHPWHNYTYSAALRDEAAQWHDVLALPMTEGIVTTNKEFTGKGNWGTEAEIGMSRKVFLWFELALRLFRTASYVAKGDDDMFMRVPQFLANLRVLPRRGVFWGLPIGWAARKRSVQKRFRFGGGMCYILSRDTVLQFVSHEPLQRLVHLPYSSERESEFLSLEMHHEDVMVGRVLFLETPNPPSLFAAAGCEFHDIRNSTGDKMVTSHSVVVHHLSEDDYSELMQQFGNGETYKPRVRICKRGKRVCFRC